MNLPETLVRLKRSLPGQVEPELIKVNQNNGRINLLQLSWLRPVLLGRGAQLALQAIMLAGLLFTIAAGLFGPRVGSHNFAIIFVWIAWWSALKLAFIPLGGRSWCSVCPIPLPGDWLQRGGIVGRGGGKGLNLRWPKKMRGGWLQSGAFLVIGLFSAVTLTDPRLAGWVLLGLFILAIGMSLVFEKRSFCTHICPIGGFSGLYARTAPLEIHVIDTAVCATHGDKSCYHACPWGLYPVALRDSSACGLCLECLRACPRDNLALNLRPYGSDLAQPRAPIGRGDALLALVMIGSALSFAAVFVGPWGWLKSAAFAIGSLAWVGYALGFLAINLVAIPGVFALAVWSGQKLAGGVRPFMRTVTQWAQVLIPLGLALWMAFTVSFALPKMGYVLQVLSDPFGSGWNLLGEVDLHLGAEVAMLSPILQALILVVGLFGAGVTGRRLAEREGTDGRQVWPVIAFCLLVSITMLWLLVG